MELNDLSEKVLSKFSKTITDSVFCFIENDRELMYDYLRTVEVKGLDVTNRFIGKAIKTRYGLENENQRIENPNSKLIQSHQQFQ